MFGKKESDEELKAFEARLAALRPRADRLDPQWRSVLEKECLPSPLGRGAGGEGGIESQSPPSPSALTLTLSRRERGRCTAPAGHCFVCVHCGSEATLSVRRRWPWPVAFSAMTSAAAVLLVMLVMRHSPSGVPAHSPLGAAAGASASAEPSFRPSDTWAGQPAPDADEGRMSYLRLREQVLRHGVAWLDRPPATSTVLAIPSVPSEKPLSNRELLNRLIDEQGLRGS